MKRLALITGFVLIAAMAFAGAQQEGAKGTPAAATPAAAKVVLTFSTWTITEKTFGDPVQIMLQKFQDKHPNVDIKILGVPFAQYKDQLVIAAAGGNPPDVIHGNSQTMITYYAINLLEPLDQLASKELLADIFPSNLKGVTFDGHIMAIPWAPHPNPLIYNKDLMQKAGLDPNKPPVEWADMDRMARTVTKLGADEKGNQIWGMGIADGKQSHSGVVFLALVLAHGGSFFDATGKKPTIDTEPVRQAFREMKVWAQDNVIPTGVWQVDIRGLFSAKRLGFNTDFEGARGIYRQTSGEGAAFDKILGVTVMPKSPVTGRSETVFTEHELAVGKASKNKKMAMDLVEHFVSKDMMIYYHGTNDVLSARKSIASLPEMQDPYSAVFIKQLETATPLPAANPAYDNAMLLITQALERVLVNNEDIDAVLRDTQAKVTELYK